MHGILMTLDIGGMVLVKKLLLTAFKILLT